MWTCYLRVLSHLAQRLFPLLGSTAHTLPNTGHVAQPVSLVRLFSPPFPKLQVAAPRDPGPHAQLAGPIKQRQHIEQTPATPGA
jgi:hypothetical protein